MTTQERIEILIGKQVLQIASQQERIEQLEAALKAEREPASYPKAVSDKVG